AGGRDGVGPRRSGRRPFGGWYRTPAAAFRGARRRGGHRQKPRESSSWRRWRRGGNTWSLSSKRRPRASRILRLVSIRQFMPFSTLWIVRRATLALRASCAWVMSRFSRSSRTRFGCTLDPFASMPGTPSARAREAVASRLARRFDQTPDFFRVDAALGPRTPKGPPSAPRRGSSAGWKAPEHAPPPSDDPTFA